MRVRAYIDGTDISGAVLVDGLTITQDSTEAVSTANVSFVQKYGDARYDQAEYDHASYRYTWNAQEWAQIELVDQDTSQILFAGFVMSVQRSQEGPHIRVQMDASDWGILFERAVMTQVWPPNTLDSTIISDCLRMVPNLSAGTIVTMIGDLGEISVKDQRVRDVLDYICTLTGGEWNVSYDGKLNYYRTGSIVAPFDLCDRPEPDENDVQYQLEDYQSDFSQAANRILVLGALDDISEVRETAEDLSSQRQYGVLSATVVQRDIFDPATAQLWAQSEIARRAWPQLSVKVAIFVPGLTRGMTVLIESIKYGLSATLILRQLTITIVAPDRDRPVQAGHVLRYQASLGPRTPDLVYTLRRMQRESPESTFAPVANIPPGSITAEDFASSIEPVHVVDVLPPLPDPDYSDTAIALQTSDRKLYRRTGNTWTAYVSAADIEGQLQTPQFAPGSITSTILADGSVVTAKIPAGAITAPQLAASSVTANAIAANAVYAQAIQANAVTAQAIAANAITAGKIAALAVTAGTIASNAVIAGTIAAGAVRAGALDVGAVTAGTIAAGAIRAQDAVFVTGAIQSADIQSLSGDKIIAHTITADKLSAVELAIGYGGDKPGRIGVYAPPAPGQPTLFALIGDMTAAGVSGLFGIWARVAAFGGTGYQDSKFYTDVNGNVFLRNVSFTITAADNSTIVTSPTTFDASYANALALTITKPADSQTAFVSRGMVVRNSSGSTIGALVRSPSDASTELTLYSAGLTRTVFLEGSTGNASLAAINAASVAASGGYTGGAFKGSSVDVGSGDCKAGVFKSGAASGVTHNYAFRYNGNAILDLYEDGVNRGPRQLVFVGGICTGWI